MTYALICLPFLAVAVVIAVIASRRMTARERRRRWIATAIAAAIGYAKSSMGARPTVGPSRVPSA